MGRITVEGCRCDRCKHEWVPRAGTYPKVCPNCHSPYWDTPRRTVAKGTGST